MSQVLVVEADQVIAEVIADELKDAGHLVDVVANGDDALSSWTFSSGSARLIRNVHRMGSSPLRTCGD